jgi:hypothetical protein
VQVRPVSNPLDAADREVRARIICIKLQQVAPNSRCVMQCGLEFRARVQFRVSARSRVYTDL